MNRCKYCGRLLTLTPEYDTCMECQGRIMRETIYGNNGGFATNSTKSNVNIYDEALKIIAEAKVHNIHQDYFGCVQFEKALERAKKIEELLELYRFKNYNMEDYYTYNSLRGSQQAFDNLKNINEEICIKENELEELK